MRRRRFGMEVVLVALIVLAVGLLPSCRGGDDDVLESEPVITDQETLPPIESLELPQANSTIGVSVTSVPTGLAVTLNTSYWIELVDLRNRAIQYSIVGIPPVTPGPVPATVAEFEQRVRESPNSKVMKNGKLDTKFGPAEWVSGSYDDDDGPVVDVQIFVPHPSGSGNMVLRSVCPRGTSSVEESLSVMKELLTHVS